MRIHHDHSSIEIEGLACFHANYAIDGLEEIRLIYESSNFSYFISRLFVDINRLTDIYIWYLIVLQIIKYLSLSLVSLM